MLTSLKVNGRSALLRTGFAYGRGDECGGRIDGGAPAIPMVRLAACAGDFRLARRRHTTEPNLVGALGWCPTIYNDVETGATVGAGSGHAAVRHPGPDRRGERQTAGPVCLEIWLVACTEFQARPTAGDGRFCDSRVSMISTATPFRPDPSRVIPQLINCLKCTFSRSNG